MGDPLGVFDTLPSLMLNGSSAGLSKYGPLLLLFKPLSFIFTELRRGSEEHQTVVLGLRFQALYNIYLKDAFIFRLTLLQDLCSGVPDLDQMFFRCSSVLLAGT